MVENAEVGRPWSASEDATVMTAHDDAMPIDELAAALGRDRDEVWARLATFGRVTADDLPSAPITGLFPRFVFPPDLER